MRFLISFFRYLKSKVASLMLFGGGAFSLIFGFMLVQDLVFHATAVETTAVVKQVQTNCKLSWKTWTLKGSRTRYSDEMNCFEAWSIKRNDRAKDYRVVERKQFLLAYAAPDGSAMEQWSRIQYYQGRPLAEGSILTVTIDPEDPSDLRRIKDAVDFLDDGMIFFAALFFAFIGLVMTFYRSRRPTFEESLERKLENIRPRTRDYPS